MEQTKRPNFTQDVTDQLIRMLEEEQIKPWEKSWDGGVTKAFNPYTRSEGGKGRAYRGGNALHLLMAQIERDSPDPRWLTFNQAKDAGFSIRKGARAESVMFWKFDSGKERWQAADSEPSAAGVYKLKSGGYAKFDDAGWWAEASTVTAAQATKQLRADAGEPADPQWAVLDREETRPTPLYAAVFNGADVVGLPPMKERRVFDANARAERLIQATGAVIEHRELTSVGKGLQVNACFYDPKEDKVVVPPRGHFKTPADYYRSVVHEIGHWTGHESRLNRLDDAKPGTAEYAREELRAEMASAMICTALGVQGGLDDHAGYLEHYVQLLKQERGALFKAARDAEKIYDMVLSFDPELRAEIEGYIGDNAITKDDPAAQQAKVATVKKLVKGDLPDFRPKSPAAPSPVKPEAPAPQAVAAPVQAPADVEVAFGDLSLGDTEKAATAQQQAATSVADEDAEIGLDPDEVGDDFDEMFGDVEVDSGPR